MLEMHPLPDRMFSTDSPKAIKASEYGYLNAILYMAPADKAGVGNLCPKATAACVANCLGWYSGQAAMVKGEALNNVRKSRINKARHFMRNRAEFMAAICRDIARNRRKASKLGKRLCIRLNGSTDIAWEGVAVYVSPELAASVAKLSGGECTPAVGFYRNVMSVFPDVQFVDYTKIAARFERVLPANYALTFSRSETNEAEARRVLKLRGNVAVVFANALPRRYLGKRVINGDAHDLRHLDPRGVVVGLLPKGAKARKDATGFVVRLAA